MYKEKPKSVERTAFQKMSVLSTIFVLWKYLRIPFFAYRCNKTCTLYPEYGKKEAKIGMKPIPSQLFQGLEQYQESYMAMLHTPEK